MSSMPAIDGSSPVVPAGAIKTWPDLTQADRDAVMDRLRKAGIGCNPYFVPIHLQPYVMELLGTKVGDFPTAERVAARTIALPFFANLAEHQVHRVKDELLNAIHRL